MNDTTLDVLKRILDMDETISHENAEDILFDVHRQHLKIPKNAT